MSASIQNNTASPAAVADKIKKIALSAQSTKYMVFGNWFIDRLVKEGQMTAEAITESRKILGMWSSVEDQIALYDGFVAELKTNTKEMKTLIRQFHKPPKVVKKAKTAASEGEKKRGRKKKEVTEEQDPILALNERLVAAAQSDEPIVNAPEYVRAPKAPDTDSQEIKTPEPLTEEEAANKPAKPTRPTKKVKVNKPEEEAVVKEDANAAAKELAKSEEKAAKEAEKAAKEAEKLAKAEAKAEEKAAKELAKAEEKAAKELAKAEEKLAKAAAKPAKVAKEPKKKVDAVLPIPVLARNSPVNAADDEEEEELECEVFKIDDIEYLIDSSNTIYDRNTQEIIGTYDSNAKKINKC